MSNKRLEVIAGGGWHNHGTVELAEALRPVLAQHIPEGSRLDAVISACEEKLAEHVEKYGQEPEVPDE